MYVYKDRRNTGYIYIVKELYFKKNAISAYDIVNKQKYKFPGADSLEYLSVEGLVSAVHYNMKTTPSDGVGGHCTACLTGEYPGGLPEDDW